MRKTLLLAAFVAMTTACATTQNVRHNWTPKQFTADQYTSLKAGMTPDELTQIFGSPDEQTPMTFGRETGEPWDGVAMRYYIERDPRYQYVDVWTQDTFYFYRGPGGELMLNHWSLARDEHSDSATSGAQP